MRSSKLKVESGLQLLARLTKKSGINNFYPLLFETGPEPGHVIELYSNQSTKHLFQDVITESLLANEVGGVEASVLIFNIDGHLSLDDLLHSLKRKLQEKIHDKENLIDYNKIDKLLHIALKNLFIIDIEDITQFYTTIQNLENILSKHSHISLLAFDSLTAYYWSEQDYKITKMDTYLKKILLTIQKVTKDYKITILYTRPEYFSSTKETIEKLDKCTDRPSNEQVNYRIQIVYNTSGSHYLNIQTHDKVVQRAFNVNNEELILA